MRDFVLVSPDFFSSEGIQAVSPPARLMTLAIGLLADEDGMIPLSSDLLRAYAFPTDTGLDVDSILDELVAVGFLEVHVCCDRDYLYAPAIHQRIEAARRLRGNQEDDD